MDENKISCKLTTPELRQRKATVIALLKEMILEKQELANGFRYQFDGKDQTLDLLHDFIKTERQTYGCRSRISCLAGIV